MTTVKTRRQNRRPPAPVTPAGTRVHTDTASPSLRELMHDLANALGGARLRVSLLRAENQGSSLDRKDLGALERLLNQACAIEETLHAEIRRALLPSASGAAPRPRRARSAGTR